MCPGTIEIRQYQWNTTYLLATCFDPAGSSSGLHYEPINVRKLRTFLGSQPMFTYDKYERLVSIVVCIVCLLLHVLFVLYVLFVVVCIFCVVCIICLLLHVFLCCMYGLFVVACIVCVVCIVCCMYCFVSFSVLFVCICVLYYCHRVATQLQLNIYPIISYIISITYNMLKTCTVFKNSLNWKY
jgi:hypothetical protein